MTKTEYILQNPELNAAELVEKAKAENIKISTGMVHTIRSSAKRKNKRKSGPRKPRKAPLPTATARKPQAEPEKTLRLAIANIGLTRAREVLNQVQLSFGVER